MPGNDGENLLAQDAEQVGLAGGPALMREQDLQALARHRRGAPAKEIEHVHAALRPNILSRRPFSGSERHRVVSPWSRRAASI